jgi:hypothetical protein
MVTARCSLQRVGREAPSLDPLNIDALELQKADVECGQARRDAPGEPVRFDVAAPHLWRAMKPNNRPPKTTRRQSIQPANI